MYAIIEDSGTQIRVTQGDVIKVAVRSVPEDQPTLTFDKVLLVGPGSGKPDSTPANPDDASGEPLHIGRPLVQGASVTAEVLAQERTPRVPVVKFKRRKTYLRRKSHRQDYLKVRVTAIELGGD